MSQNLRPGAGGTAALGEGRRFRPVAWLAPAGLLLLAGCGGGKGEVTGQVLYNGEPLSMGRITFVSETGKQEAFSSYVIRGKYTIKGCPAGPVKISVESLEPPTKEQIEAYTKQPPRMAPEMHERMSQQGPPPEMKEIAEGPPLKHMKIPPQYADPDKSGLTYTVTRGSQEHTVELTK
jgi:hypothetical protein